MKSDWPWRPMDPQTAWIGYMARRLGISRYQMLRRVILAYWRYIGRDVAPDHEGRVHAMRPTPPAPDEVVLRRPRDRLIELIRLRLSDPTYPLPPMLHRDRRLARRLTKEAMESDASDG